MPDPLPLDLPASVVAAAEMHQGKCPTLVLMAMQKAYPLDEPPLDVAVLNAVAHFFGHCKRLQQAQ